MIDGEESWQGWGEKTMLYVQFCYESKNALKNKVYYKNLKA